MRTLGTARAFPVAMGRGRSVVAWLTPVAALVSACAANTPQPVEPASAPAPRPRVTYSLKEPAPLAPFGASHRHVSVARPEECEGTDQPAIVAFELSGEEVGPPIWSCFAGCGPAREYVTNAYKYRRRDDVELTASCVPTCDGETHRVSYSTVQHSESCAPGATEDGVAASLAREQERQGDAFVERRTTGLSSVETQVLTAERAPKPWNGEVLTAWRAADDALRSLDYGNDPWNERSRDDRGLSYAAAHTLRARQEAMAARIAPGLAALSKSLRARVERLRKEGTAAERREQEGMIQSRCVERCSNAHATCARVCDAAGRTACAACAVEEANCEGTCKSPKARR